VLDVVIEERPQRQQHLSLPGVPVILEFGRQRRPQDVGRAADRAEVEALVIDPAQGGEL